MKKIFIIFVLAAVISCCTFTVFSSGITNSSSSQNGTTQVTYTVNEPTYTVTIPATAELDKAFEIKATNVELNEGTQLTVTLSDATKDENGKFVLQSGTDIIQYTPKIADNNSSDWSTAPTLTVGDTIFNVLHEQNSASKFLYLAMDKDGIYAPGTYSGVLTFTIEVKAAN